MGTEKKVVFGTTLLGIVSIAAAWLTRTRDQTFTKQGLLTTDSRQLQGTVVTPQLVR
jgi:hypothetical protein